MEAIGNIHHLILRIEVEIADLEPSNDIEDVEDAVRGFSKHESEVELKFSIIKRPYRGNRKVYVLLKEAKALKFLKETHIKIAR